MFLETFTDTIASIKKLLIFSAFTFLSHIYFVYTIRKNLVSISGYKATAGLSVVSLCMKRSANTYNYRLAQKGFQARCDRQITWNRDDNAIKNTNY